MATTDLNTAESKHWHSPTVCCAAELHELDRRGAAVSKREAAVVIVEVRKFAVSLISACASIGHPWFHTLHAANADLSERLLESEVD